MYTECGKISSYVELDDCVYNNDIYDGVETKCQKCKKAFKIRLIEVPNRKKGK